MPTLDVIEVFEHVQSRALISRGEIFEVQVSAPEQVSLLGCAYGSQLQIRLDPAPTSPLHHVLKMQQCRRSKKGYGNLP